jgi:hypothetical protein
VSLVQAAVHSENALHMALQWYYAKDLTLCTYVF